MSMRRLFQFVMMFALAGFRPVAAEDSAGLDTLRIEMKEMAKELAAIVKKRGGGPVVIGQFSASTDLGANSGPRVQLMLAEEFKTQGIEIDPKKYRYEVKGDFQPVTDKESKLFGIQVLCRLIERENADVLVERPSGRFVFGTQTVPEFLGVNLNTSPNADAAEASEEFKRAFDKPGASISGTKIRTVPASPFAVELLVKSNGNYLTRPLTPDAEGRPMVAIKQDEVYGVRLYNDAPFEAAVDLRIDGISSFQFSETKSTFWIVPPGSHADILGWHKTNEETLEFKVVDFPNSAAKLLNLQPSGSIGLITASFSAAWEQDANKPRDEATGRGTGFGKVIKVGTKQVPRTIGHQRDIISIRYER